MHDTHTTNAPNDDFYAQRLKSKKTPKNVIIFWSCVRDYILYNAI